MVLKFSIKVAECDIIFIIQSAIVHGKLGELGVNVTHIIGIPPVEQSTTAAPTSTVKLGGLFLFLTDTTIINFILNLLSVHELPCSNQLFRTEYVH